MIKARIRSIWSILRFVAPLIISLLVVYDIFTLNKSWYCSRDIVAASRNLNRSDTIDLSLILGSLATKHTFLSTFAWWHTSWIPDVPFWRPLTIQTFWLENRLFTTDHYDRWLWVTFITHLTSIFFFGWFVALLTRRKDATWLAVAIYAVWRGTPTFLGYIGSFLVGVPAEVASDAWKNQPDLFADTFLFACLVLMLKRYYWPAIAMAFISVAFKESGWMTWFIAGFVLLYNGQLKTLPKPVLIGTGVAILVLLALRFSAGMEVVKGYHVGANAFWAFRLTNGLVPDYANALVVSPYCFLLAHVIFLTTWLRKRKRIWESWAILAAGVCISVGYQMVATKTTLDVVLASYTDPGLFSDNWQSVTHILVCLYFTGAVLTNSKYRNLGLLAAACSVVSALPYAAAGQVLRHALHQSYAFQSLVWAIGFLAILDTWKEKWRVSRANRRPSTQSPAALPIPAG